jgi:hypothetical protein
MTDRQRIHSLAVGTVATRKSSGRRTFLGMTGSPRDDEAAGHARLRVAGYRA